MSDYMYLLTICLPLGTILVIFALKYWSAAQQAKARTAQAAATQPEMASVLASIDRALSDVRERLGAIEKILKEVE